MVFNISYQTLIGAKPLHIRFDKVNKFITVYDGTRYLKLLELGKYCVIFNKTSYLIGVKSDIVYVISHNYEKFEADQYDFSHLEKR